MRPEITQGESGIAGGGGVINPNIGADPTKNVADNYSTLINRFNETTADYRTGEGLYNLYRKLFPEPPDVPLPPEPLGPSWPDEEETPPEPSFCQ